MKYNFFLILLIVLITSCTSNNYKTANVDPILEKFSNNGFALIYNDKLYNDKIISKKMDERDLIIFQRNLRKGTSVKITNPFNSKTIIAKVGKKFTKRRTSRFSCNSKRKRQNCSLFF